MVFAARWPSVRVMLVGSFQPGSQGGKDLKRCWSVGRCRKGNAEYRVRGMAPFRQTLRESSFPVPCPAAIEPGRRAVLPPWVCVASPTGFASPETTGLASSPYSASWMIGTCIRVEA